MVNPQYNVSETLWVCVRDYKGDTLRDLVDRGVPRASPLFHDRLFGLSPFFKMLGSVKARLNHSIQLYSYDLLTRLAQVFKFRVLECYYVILDEPGQLKKLLATIDERACNTGFEGGIQSCVDLERCFSFNLVL